MSVNALINKLTKTPESVEFSEVIEIIQQYYHYTATNFTNGDVINQAGTNEGSCKIFAFAKLNQLNEQQTLACFGDYYRKDVLQHPENSDHANIRSFIQSGWAGITFDGVALVEK